MMKMKLTKDQDPARETVGLTVDDLRDFCDEATRAGIPGTTVLTRCTVSIGKGKLKHIEAEA